VIAIQVDLSTPGAGQITAEQLSKSGIPIDLLVNNAGFGVRGEFRDLSLARQLEMLRLNNQAIVELTYSLLPAMLERRQKGIINISSTAGFQPIPFASLYSASKAFVTTFSLALEHEPAATGRAFTRVTRKSCRTHCECSKTAADSRFPELLTSLVCLCSA
jgi:short-subunit dehydrogenase